MDQRVDYTTERTWNTLASCLTGKNLNYKNLIVTTKLENIHLVPELLTYGTVYQITLRRPTLLMHLRIVLTNTGLIKMLFMTANHI